MAGKGFRPYRGNWSIRKYTTASTSTFRQYAPVSLSSVHLLKEFAGGAANEKMFGIALHASVDSLPAGEVLVAIPGYGATALGNVQTGVAASALSLGFAFDIEKSANNMQIDVDSTTSACVMLMGPINSATSEIEVAFTVNSLLLPPLSSVADGF
jgi:hypothetical protein